MASIPESFILERQILTDCLLTPLKFHHLQKRDDLFQSGTNFAHCISGHA